MTFCEIIIDPEHESFHWDFDADYRQNIEPPKYLCGLPAVDEAVDEIEEGAYAGIWKIPVCALHADMWNEMGWDENPAAKAAHEHFFGKKNGLKHGLRNH